MSETFSPRRTKSITTILRITALLSYAVGCYPCFAAPDTSHSRGQPVTVEDGIVLVEVTVNGRGPFRMVVDTGAHSCVLSPSAAKNAALVYDHRTIVATLNGEIVVPAASTNLIQVGDRSESNVDVVVMEVPQSRALHSRVDGVLGQSFLSRTPYLIDYRKGRIWVGPEAEQEAERLPVAMSSGGTTGRIVVPVVLEPGGKTWRLTLDSGASHMVVECRDNCPATGRLGSSERLMTFSGEQSVSRSTFRRVTAGGVAMPVMDVLVVNVTPPDNQDEGVLPTRWFSAVYVDGFTVKVAGLH